MHTISIKYLLMRDQVFFFCQLIPLLTKPATAGQARLDPRIDMQIVRIIVKSDGRSLCDMLRLLLSSNADRVS